MSAKNIAVAAHHFNSWLHQRQYCLFLVDMYCIAAFPTDYYSKKEAWELLNIIQFEALDYPNTNNKQQPTPNDIQTILAGQGI